MTRDTVRRIRENTKKQIARLAFFRLEMRMRLSPERSILGETPAIVSLTTHGNRVATVWQTLESIRQGASRPRRVVLWVDSTEVFDRASVTLAEYVQAGLEVRLTENLGPHTKYYPSLAEIAVDPTLSLVTADDDIIYPRSWLGGLMKALQKDPEAVHCYRAHRITVTDGRVDPYSRWRRHIRWSKVEKSPRVFATGVSGVVYPRKMVDALRAQGTAFLSVAPRADDVWLHYVAVLEGVPVIQVGILPRHFPLVSGSQDSRLMNENVENGGNDAQISATYSPIAIDAICSGQMLSGSST